MPNHLPLCHSNKIQACDKQLNTYFLENNLTIIDKSIFWQCQVLTIIQKCYIVVHFRDSVYLIDQHGASQKVLYMQIYHNLLNNKKRESIKAEEVIYYIANLYRGVLIEQRERIDGLGWAFQLGETGGTSTEIKILKQPLLLGTNVLGQQELIYYLEQMYDTEGQQYQQTSARIDLSLKEKQIIAAYACHKSYRFGQQISLEKAQQLIRKLADIQAPFNCPHSRVLISFYGNVKQLGLTF